MVNPYNGVLFTHKKKWSTDPYYKMGEPWIYAKWLKSDKRGHLRYNSTYMKCSESIGTENMWLVFKNSVKRFPLGHEDVLEVGRGDGWMMFWLCQMTLNYTH